LGISVPSVVLADALVCTTTLSPVFAVFESSLLTSSPLTGLICTAGAAGFADWLFDGADSAPGELCWVEEGLSGWLAGGGCCARSGKLAMANRVVARAVPVFMKILRFSTLPHPYHVHGAVTRFEMFCKLRAKPEVSADCVRIWT
jgi:hypothetical protein